MQEVSEDAGHCTRNSQRQLKHRRLVLILNENHRLWRVLMNRHLLLGLIIVVLLAAAGCPPRQPPHTPQPYSMKAETSGSTTGH